MATDLERLRTALCQRVVIVSGKGGVGKTTVSGVLARALERGGSRVLALEVDPRESLHRLFGVSPSGGHPVEVSPGLRLLHLRYDLALEAVVRAQVSSEWLRRRILNSAAWQHVVAGAPGFKELAVLWWMFRQVEHVTDSAWSPEVVVLDAPAGGHAAAWLRAPSLVVEAVHSGPVADQARRLDERLRDPRATAIVLVSTAEEMPVTETLEFQQELHDLFPGRRAGICCVNGLYPAPSAVDRDLARLDPALGLWVQETDVQRTELRRLRAALEGDVFELPMLPLTAGPELVAALLSRLSFETSAATRTTQ